jgi:methylated-DNA-protein-cysteine methyltransferase-like protein
VPSPEAAEKETESMTPPFSPEKSRAVRDFTREVIRLIKAVPPGKVVTYGQIASMAGLYSSVRRVVWILHSSTEKEGLPWHRVVNRKGGISLKPGAGYERQKALLQKEGIVFDVRDRIDLERFRWEPDEEEF